MGGRCFEHIWVLWYVKRAESAGPTLAASPRVRLYGKFFYAQSAEEADEVMQCWAQLHPECYAFLFENHDERDIQHPRIRKEDLVVGTVIVYHLRPEDDPVDPERPWRGRILTAVIGQRYRLDAVLVESLEEGFESDREWVLLTQIVGIEPQRKGGP